MRYTTLIIIILISTFPSMGERYAVYKSTAGVTVLDKRTNTRIQLEKRAPLKLDDILTIPSNGSVSILDKESSQIFRCSEYGDITVKNLIDHAKENNKKIIRHINSEISATKKKSHSATSLTALGVGSREPVSPNVYRYLAKAICQPNVEISPEGPLLTIQKADDDAISFQITNPCDHEVMVNIAKIDTLNNRLTLCFLLSEESAKDNLMIQPFETVDYLSFKFTPPAENEILIPFSTGFLYNPVVLNRFLNKPVEPKVESVNSIFIGKII